jgi:hypothetical protein
MQPQCRSFISMAGRCGLGIFLLCIAWPLIAPLVAEQGLEDVGLVAHWNFEDGSGNTVKDLSANGNNGTIVLANAPEPKWGTGEFAGSMYFNGSTFVRIRCSESLNRLKKQITVLAHIYPKSLWTPPPTAALQRFWRKVAHSTEKLLGLGTDIEGSGYIAVVQRQWRDVVHPDLFYLGYGKKSNVLHYKWHIGLIGEEVSLYRLPADQDKPVVNDWVHLAGSYSGETGKMSLYVNGKLIGSETHVGEIRLDQESLNRPLVIGGELNGPSIDDASNEFNGYVDDVRIYDRALSDGEIKNLAEDAQKRTNK